MISLAVLLSLSAQLASAQTVSGNTLAKFNAAVDALPPCAKSCLVTTYSKFSGADIPSIVCGDQETVILNDASNCAGSSATGCTTISDTNQAQTGFNLLYNACGEVQQSKRVPVAPSAPTTNSFTAASTAAPGNVNTPPQGLPAGNGTTGASVATTAGTAASATSAAVAGVPTSAATGAGAVWSGCKMASGAYLSIVTPYTGSSFAPGDKLDISWQMLGTQDPAFATLQVSFEIDDASNPNNAVAVPNGKLSFATQPLAGDLKASAVVPASIPNGKAYTVKSIITDGALGPKECFSPQFAILKGGVAASGTSVAAQGTNKAVAPTTQANVPAKSVQPADNNSAGVRTVGAGLATLAVALLMAF
ncbi:hypothetical protein BC830DRAFT_1146205 [Chytriomyces sp. MP71]|nr:hypothetical protein BC830DRAFT_1146205 [Chytriomyces sp. MP71]